MQHNEDIAKQIDSLDALGAKRRETWDQASREIKRLEKVLGSGFPDVTFEMEIPDVGVLSWRGGESGNVRINSEEQSGPLLGMSVKVRMAVFPHLSRFIDEIKQAFGNEPPPRPTVKDARK